MHIGMTPHQQEATARLSPVGKKLFHLIEFDDDEILMLEIRKHPFGLFLRIVTGFLIMLFFLIMAVLLSSNFQGSTVGNDGSFNWAIFGVAVLLSALTGIGILLVVIVYINDVIFVTSEKIAQVLYKNIITRKVSQLNIGDVQDVTVNQNGIFARIFNYGTLVIETAGEQNNYIFTYVPYPTRASQIVIESHEKNVAKFGN